MPDRPILSQSPPTPGPPPAPLEVDRVRPETDETAYLLDWQLQVDRANRGTELYNQQ